MAKCFSVRFFCSLLSSNVTRRPLEVSKQPFKMENCRKISLSCIRFGYEGPGKTTASFVEDEVGKFIMITSANEQGFHLSNGAFAVGSIILFPSFVFKWKVKTIDDITPESLTLFRMIQPKIELLILGIGHSNYWSTKSIQTLKTNLQKVTDLKIEIMPTRDAISTYNFMLSDFRLIGGAFLPFPSDVEQKLLKAK